ncbi:hypothetical protein Tco_0412170 [Tanacetum coccineum]
MADKETKSTMREFATNDQANYYLGITSITVNRKNAYELKEKFLDDLHNNAFSGTNGEYAVEHIKYFLRIVDPIDLPNVNQDKLRVVVFPISFVGDAWRWFDEIKGSIDSWVDLTAKFFRKYYPPSRTGRVNTPKIKWDPTNQKFENWLAPKFVNYKTMDIFTKGALWDYWKLGSDEIEPTDEKFLNLEKEDWSDEDETAKIFKIKDDLLDYETPFSDIDGFCNGGELSGMVGVGCMTYFQDHKCFENFHELDYDVLVQLEECWWKVNAHEKATFAQWKNYGQGLYVNAKTKKDYNHNLDNNNAGYTQDTKKERHDPSVCNIRIFEMIKYSFRDDKEYVAIKENEYDDFTNTSREAIHAYQEIFHMMDEG